jgi:hypothetical protein
MTKYYYIIEGIDIDGNKNEDGFIISRYKIDKNGNKIFIKTKYLTFDELKLIKNKIKFMSGGFIDNNQQPQQLVVLTQEQLNQLLQNKNQQQPQYVAVDNGKETFTDKISNGFAYGIGFNASDLLFDAIF